MKKIARHNLGESYRTVTIRGFIPWDPASSRRIWEACRQQAAAHNRGIEELIARPATPLRKRSKRKAKGLQGLWPEWRTTEPKLDGILQAVWRPGVSLAKTRVDAWETTNAEHAAAVLASAEATNDATEEKRARGERRTLCADTLYISRKRRDRRRTNRLVIHEGTRAVDPKTLRIPGVGDVALREALPDDFQIRSITVIERTPPGRGRRCTPESRSWKVHLTTRLAAPLRPLPATPASAGCDHGIVHALTVASSNGSAEHLHYDTPEATRSRRYERLEERKKRCRQGRHPSRKRRALQRQQNRLRRRALGQRAHQRRAWANRIASQHDLVGIELLQNANMRRSARGTSEQPGRNVAAKSGLNRKLAESSPGYQTGELVSACIRHGTRYRLVPAAGTSIELLPAQDVVGEQLEAALKAGPQRTAPTKLTGRARRPPARLTHEGGRGQPAERCRCGC